jgi:sugar-specific transcriptional regulator TrmB
LSLKRVLESLQSLGLSQGDAEVYIYLSKEGPKTGRQIICALRLSEQKLYASLKKMNRKKIIIKSDDNPAFFSAIPFEEVITLLVKIKKEQSAAILESKEEFLSIWKSVEWENKT